MILTIIACWFAFNALLFIWLEFVRYHKWSKPVSARVASTDS